MISKKEIEELLGYELNDCDFLATDSESSDKVNFNCEKCNVPLEFNEYSQYCSNCGISKEFIGSFTETVKTKHYKRVNHFRKWIRSIQDDTNVLIDNELIQDIKKVLEQKELEPTIDNIKKNIEFNEYVKQIFSFIPNILENNQSKTS
jgi:protein-arginine kinase activator protein McsA